MTFNLGNFADQLSLGGDNPLGGMMGDPVTLGVLAGSQLLNGAMQGMQKKPAGVLQIQPNKYSDYYQDLYPAMLKNAFSAFGDNTASNVAGSSAYSGMFNSAGGGQGYANTGRSPMGYSNPGGASPMGGSPQPNMQSMMGMAQGLIPQIANAARGAQGGNPMGQPGTQGPGNPNVMRTRQVR